MIKDMTHMVMTHMSMMMVVMMMVVMMMMVMMASLQALLYQQDDETVFTVEYDIAKQVGGSLLRFLNM